MLNDSSSPIIVSYSSSANATGPVSKEIVLKEGEHCVIISTGDLERNLENLCQVVADNVVAYRQKDGVESTLKWCNEDIVLERVDIGQFQFLVSYNDVDF